MTDEKIRLKNEGPFEVNEKLAGLVPMAIPAEQEALTQDILENEQTDAIILWRGRVVDGRCRQQALVTLGKHIMYKELDSELTEQEVAIFVKSVNTRRSLTLTQKAMSAARSKLLGTDTRANLTIAKSWAVGKDMFQNAKYIWETREDLAKDLFDGKGVNIVDAKGNATTSTKVMAVYAHLKRVAEQVATIDEGYGWDANSYIETQVGKDWFYKTIAEVKGDSSSTNKLIAELANFKFIKEST